jgi:hypothetical protein
MMKYLVAGGAFALVLAITQAFPAEAAVSLPPASRPALASGHAPETFVLASIDLSTVGAAPKEDGSDSGDDGGDGGDDSGQ